MPVKQKDIIAFCMNSDANVIGSLATKARQQNEMQVRNNLCNGWGSFTNYAYLHLDIIKLRLRLCTAELKWLIFDVLCYIFVWF